MPQQAIYDAIPHREPFLLVDQILEQEPARIVCTKVFSGQEDFFAGHYPGHAAGAGRAAVRGRHAVGRHPPGSQLDRTGGKLPVVTRINDVRFKRIVRPGETIRIEVELVERLADAFFLKAKATVDGKLAVRFEFACTAAALDAGT